MAALDLLTKRLNPDSPSFSVANRVRRVAWRFVWTIAARWTPPPLRPWRVLLLRMFGARADKSAIVYSSAIIWAPWNLEIDAFGCLGPRSNCYNIAKITIGRKAIVSQDAFLCSGTHDYRDPRFPLFARPINVGAMAWVCARAFVGPGVNVGTGAVLGATASAFQDLDAWTVYSGNPAAAVGTRPHIDEENMGNSGESE
jgi:putative colanic acid biosynthesis acetyltransferase WcaF